MASLPKFTKAIVIQKSKDQDTAFKNDAALVEIPIPELQQDQILVKITAVGFNHKDVWIRKGMYPGITPGALYGGDGAGVVVASSQPNDELINKRVFLSPVRGWKDDPIAPESQFSILGGSIVKPGGTFAEYIVVEREHVLRTPDYLDDIHAAAWPLGGVTAWRSAMVNAGVKAGHNVLITGIGGGVALLALQFCVAAGASVYVTSGNQEKIQKAIALGAKGGANYKDEKWPLEILAQLQKVNRKAQLDSVIDSSGGEILAQVSKYKVLKAGGRVSCYGMTAGPKITFTMREVLANQQLIGSTMGSLKDLTDATQFIEKHKIVPVLSRVLDGLESAEQGFQLLNSGEQFGKVVIKVASPRSANL